MNLIELGNEHELQRFLLLHELQVDHLGQTIFVQHIWFGYLIELEDELLGFLLLHELQVGHLGQPMFTAYLV
jgi:hypothetical protein